MKIFNNWNQRLFLLRISLSSKAFSNQRALISKMPCSKGVVAKREGPES